MSDLGDNGSGWRPLQAPPVAMRPAVGESTDPRRLNVDGTLNVSPFVRLARTHAFHAAGDAVYAVALVGSIFALDTDAARGRILLYLLLTLAPFALVGPFIGPALDRMRGGRRLMIMATLAARGLLMLLLIRNIETLWLFPIAFTQLVMGKTYSVAKAATVPSTVNTEDELVDKNARLAVLGTVAGGIGAAPALGLQAIWGSSVTVVYAFVIYAVGLAAATRLPRVVVDDPEVPDDEVEIRSMGVRLAATAMSVLRATTGFVFWLMVFAFGDNDIDLEGTGRAAGAAVRFALGFSIEGDNSQPAWKLGFVLAAIGLGIFLGNIGAPRLRERFTEENMIIGALGVILVAALAAVWAGGLSGAVLLALVVGAAPASAKLAFDSLVQRDAPGANHGAAFGRFETRFQIASVIGSVIAVAPTVVIPVRVGALIVAIAALVAGVLYQLGSRGTIGPFGRGSAGPAPESGSDQRSTPASPAGQWAAPPTLEVDAVPAQAPAAAVVAPTSAGPQAGPASDAPIAPAPLPHTPAADPSPAVSAPPVVPGFDPMVEPQISEVSPPADRPAAPMFDPMVEASIDASQATPSPMGSAADPPFGVDPAPAEQPAQPPFDQSAQPPQPPQSPALQPERSLDDPLLPPVWLDSPVVHDPNPTPPMGTPRVEG